MRFTNTVAWGNVAHFKFRSIRITVASWKINSCLYFKHRWNEWKIFLKIYFNNFYIICFINSKIVNNTLTVHFANSAADEYLELIIDLTRIASLWYLVISKKCTICSAVHLNTMVSSLEFTVDTKKERCLILLECLSLKKNIFKL